MPRAPALANVVAAVLLLATAGAFVVAEALKLEKAPITGIRVDKRFSPVCGCATSRARMTFRLRRADHVTVSLLDSNDHVVRTLVSSRRFGKGRVRFMWDGRDDAGRLVRDGDYRPFVDLADAGRSFDIPNLIRVDTTAPEIVVARAGPRTISPDRDGRADRIRIRYRLDEPAYTALYVDGVRRVLIHGTPLAQKLDWNGRVGGRAALGRHRLTVFARDLAGNVSRTKRPIVLRVRFLSLPHVIRATAGRRFRVRLDTDLRVVEWRLGPTRGRGRARPLVVRAPPRRGRYVLVVRGRGHAARARVLVRAPR